MRKRWSEWSRISKITQNFHCMASSSTHHVYALDPDTQSGCRFQTLIGHQKPSGKRNGPRATFATSPLSPTQKTAHLALTCHAKSGLCSIAIVLVTVTVQPWLLDYYNRGWFGRRTYDGAQIGQKWRLYDVVCIVHVTSCKFNAVK